MMNRTEIGGADLLLLTALPDVQPLEAVSDVDALETESFGETLSETPSPPAGCILPQHLKTHKFPEQFRYRPFQNCTYL